MCKHEWKQGVALQQMYTDGNVIARYDSEGMFQRGAAVFPAHLMLYPHAPVAQLVSVTKCIHCGKSV